jgi:ATP-dependent RNA helicase DeaD
MQDMINRGLVNISQINFCILDEADEMLNMGFYEDIVNILSTTPDDKTHGCSLQQCLLKKHLKQFMKDPIEITVGAKIQVQLQYSRILLGKCT